MERMRVSFTTLVTVLAGFLSPGPGVAGEAPYRSPWDVAFSPSGGLLAVSDHTAGVLVLVELPDELPDIQVRKRILLEGKPSGVAWSGDGARVFVAEYGASSVAEIDAAEGRLVRRLPAGLRPAGLALSPERDLLLVANTVEDSVSFVELAGGKEKARVCVPREPHFLAVTPDASLAVAANLLPSGSAADPELAAAISLIDLDRLEHVADIRLPAGSTSVREVAVSPDGRWAYAAHTVGRFNVPSTQLDRGWVNTNALSILDLARREHEATVLLDHPFEGAADPWGLVLSANGDTLWISLRGVHQIVRLDLARLHRLLRGDLPDSLATGDALRAGTPSIWRRIAREPSAKKDLVNDLAALHVADLIQRFPLEGNGPRGVDLSPDGRWLAVAMYYSGTVLLVETATGKVCRSIPLGPTRTPDPARVGERMFHDATMSFQHWLSCSTCHPDDGRTDGLRWDLLNDGLGTPQRTRSLLLSYLIRPTTARGVRESGIEDSVPKGLLFLRRVPEPELVEPLTAYLKSLTPEPSPFLVDGKLSEAARRGEALFRGKARCSRCHPGDLGTDLEAHDVGSQGEFDPPGERYYTPKLVELYRTAPFLHDGRAATLLDVFTVHDPERRHGRTGSLEENELKDLVEYLKSR